MNPTRFGLATAFALLGPQLLVAQTPTTDGLIRHVAARHFVLVVKTDGSVVGWGNEEDGMAARPRSTGIVAVPTVIALPGKVRQVAVGLLSAYALLEDGTVVAWGDNHDGQLGNGAMGANIVLGIYPKSSVTPMRVTGLEDIIQIEAGERYALALRQDGTVWAWGLRDDGAIGDGKPTTLRPLSAIGPVQVPGLEGITRIAAGRTHNLALRRDGHVMSWGSNSEGELGIGTRFTGWTPAEVTGLDRVVAIDAGGAARGISGVIRDDGAVWMWGSNVETMMGNGEGPLSPDDPGARTLLPVPLKGIAGAKSLSLGGGHAAVLLGDGYLRMWGHDGWGQIGVGT
ncbi:MAG: hypothetical protein AABZ01_12535, partial [Gemmatimonadota bacterium]